MIRTLPAISLPTRVLPAISIVLLVCAASPAFADHLEKHFSVKPHPVIMVHNPSGKLTIQSWSKSEVLVISDHASNGVGIEEEQKGNLIEISTHVLSENVHSGDLRADYTITVPQDAELEVHDDAGTVQVIQVFGDTAVETQTAGVDLEDVGGYLKVQTVGGSVDCIRCTGRVEITSISGSLRLLQDHSSSMKAHTTSGSIFFDSDFLPDGLYVLNNYSGPIELLFSSHDSVTLHATSLRGQVNNEAGITPLMRSPVRPSRYTQSMFGNLNDGLAHVEVTSFNGTINLNKRGE
jgi:DUF4097 and DUF4098 domain-containing protein YvlB